jgi:hypothetical protein
MAEVLQPLQEKAEEKINFKLWIETKSQPRVVDFTQITEDDQNVLGNSSIAGNGFAYGFHVSDDPEKMLSIKQSKVQLTGSYKPGIHAELGPGLYVSAAPQLWMNRSRSKWDFLSTLTNQQKLALANKLRNDRVLTGTKLADGKVYQHVATFEKEYALRDIDTWLKTGHDPILLHLAGQPYNIKFYEPEYLSPLGIDPSPKKKLVKISFTGKFVNLQNHVGDWPTIKEFIRQKLDGGFNPGGFVGYPELCIWRREAITNLELTD